MFKLKSLIAVCISVSLIGCSSMEKSVLLGTGVGGATGAVIGNNHGKGSSKKRLQGAAIGAALGGLFGFLAHKGKKKKTTKKGNEEVPPLLTRPKVKRIWVKDQIKGNRYVKGHWEYIIEENSKWNR